MNSIVVSKVRGARNEQHCCQHTRIFATDPKENPCQKFVQDVQRTPWGCSATDLYLFLEVFGFCPFFGFWCNLGVMVLGVHKCYEWASRQHLYRNSPKNVPTSNQNSVLISKMP